MWYGIKVKGVLHLLLSFCNYVQVFISCFLSPCLAGDLLSVDSLKEALKGVTSVVCSTVPFNVLESKNWLRMIPIFSYQPMLGWKRKYIIFSIYFIWLYIPKYMLLNLSMQWSAIPVVIIMLQIFCSNLFWNIFLLRLCFVSVFLSISFGGYIPVIILFKVLVM